MEVFVETVCCCLDKKKTQKKTLKNFSSKNKFPQSQKSTEIYSSKYSGYRSFINIAPNVGHTQNKNFNLYTRHT